MSQTIGPRCLSVISPPDCRRVLLAFEHAKMCRDPLDARHRGAGATGVELAGAIAELANATLVQHFCRIDTASARILLIEAGLRILAGSEELVAHSEKAPAKLLWSCGWIQESTRSPRPRPFTQRYRFCCRPGWTFPITTVPTSEPLSLERVSTARTTVAPSSVAGTALRLPS